MTRSELKDRLGIYESLMQDYGADEILDAENEDEFVDTVGRILGSIEVERRYLKKMYDALMELEWEDITGCKEE